MVTGAAGPTGGEGGIRTRGGCDTSTVFKTAPFVHSGTSPPQILPHPESSPPWVKQLGNGVDATAPHLLD